MNMFHNAQVVVRDTWLGAKNPGRIVSVLQLYLIISWESQAGNVSGCRSYSVFITTLFSNNLLREYGISHIAISSMRLTW